MRSWGLICRNLVLTGGFGGCWKWTQHTCFEASQQTRSRFMSLQTSRASLNPRLLEMLRNITSMSQKLKHENRQRKQTKETPVSKLAYLVCLATSRRDAWTMWPTRYTPPHRSWCTYHHHPICLSAISRCSAICCAIISHHPPEKGACLALQRPLPKRYCKSSCHLSCLLCCHVGRANIQWDPLSLPHVH